MKSYRAVVTIDGEDCSSPWYDQMSDAVAWSRLVTEAAIVCGDFCILRGRLDKRDAEPEYIKCQDGSLCRVEDLIPILE